MVRDFTLTFSGGIQRLSSVLSDSTVGGAQDEALRELVLQPDGANGAACFFGGTPFGAAANTLLSSSVHGFSLPAGAAGVPPAPYIMGGYSDAGPLKLSDLWVIGTVAQKLHITTTPY